MGVWDTLAGAADHAAGSTDEAFARQFDDKEGGGLVDGTKEATVGAGEAVLDVPADAINASTGTGEDLGWFGVIDRKLDYRTLTGEMDADSDEWAEPTEETTGLSGATRAVAGQAAAATEDVAEPIFGKHWKLIGGAALVLLLYLAIQSSPAGMVVP